MSFQTEPFGRYFLVDKVATGGMAEVFKAKSFSHGGFEKLLVIKRILEHLSDNQEFVEMFIDEAKITVSLQHPNIVQIYDFGKIRDNYFLSMECVEGKDVKGILRKLAQRRKLLPTEFAVYIAHEMCKGLDYAHKKADTQGNPLRIIHRDISPSNILVSYTGEVKIADFGIAKAESSAYDTKDGVLKGKFEYMSPEQASGQDLDHKSDIFSAGIILHEMLTGRRLFKTESDVKTLEKIKAVDVPPPGALNPAVPARLDAIVMRALAQQPSARFQDARELQQALLEFMYPATPDLTRESLSHFMQELFSQEIDEERGRLLEGTRIASDMYAAEPGPEAAQDWQATNATTSATLKTQPSRWPLVVAAVAVLLLGAVVTWAVTRSPQERVVERVVEAQAPTTGAVQLRISPETANARVWLGDQDLGGGPMVTRDGLPSGQALVLRVVADGFEPWQETITLEGGERLRQAITLIPVAPTSLPPTTTPVSPTEAPSTVPPPTTAVEVRVEQVTVSASFSSDPSGASVTVDGRAIGTTPLTWTDGVPGRSYAVVMSKDGYESDSLTATLPATGSKSFKGTLQAKAVAPGTLQVFSGKAGPATVSVNGKAWGESPPLIKKELAPGTYTVTVTPKDGSDPVTRTVTVVSGETVKATF
ncbi:protein kinase [Myxococcota bacterium]|nr:protein kinase [Myxococcota bacterium]